MKSRTDLPLEPTKNCRWIEFNLNKKIEPHQYKNFFLWSGMAFASFCVLSVCGLRQVESRVRAMPRFSIHHDFLKLTRLPDWLLFFTQDISPVELPLDLDIFNPELCRIIAEGYLKNPWVKKVHRVSKKYPNHISVALSPRKPMVFVVFGGQYYPVDEQGVLLPVRYEKMPSTAYFMPVVHGIEMPPPRPGEVWKETALEESLQIVDYLSAHDLFSLLRIQRIDLEKNGSKKTVLLVMEEGQKIVWGNSCRSLFPPVSPEQRIQALKKIHEFSMDIDFKKIVEIDVRFGYLIIKRNPGESKKQKRTKNAR